MEGTPGPGVYAGIPMDQYHGWNAASNSRLALIAKSPAHLLAYIQEPPKEAAHFFAGRAIHSAVLEPDDFAVRYTRALPCGAELKSGERKGKQCGNAASGFHPAQGWLCGTHSKGVDGMDASRIVLPPEEWRACMGIRDSAFRLGTVRSLLGGSGEVELSILWNDPETGVPVKARWDRHSPDLPGGVIVDVKSTRDASRRAFERAIFQYRYHCQGGLYLESARVRRLPARHFVIIAAEKTPPFAVASYRLTEGALDAGMDQIRPLLRLYAKCMETNEWPAYPDAFQDVALPHYAWAQIDEDLQEIAA